MKTALGLIVAMAWALWVGGLFALFILLTAVSRQVPPSVFHQVVPPMFQAFERYQIGLGAIALTACIGWRIASGRDRLTVASILLLAAMAASIFSHLVLTPRVDVLRAGGTDTLAFREAHMQSLIAYMSATATLVLAGFFILLGFAAPPRDTARKIARAPVPRT